MKKETKPFTPYPTRPIRMDDRTWEALKNCKVKSGKSWNLFLVDLLNKK